MPQTKLPAAVVASAAATPRLAARRGRPPGKLSEAGPKEKVTLWVSAALIAEYRDWSWEARMQLSRLVERALLHFREQHRSRLSAA